MFCQFTREEEPNCGLDLPVGDGGPLVVVSQLGDHPFKTSACLRGGGVSPCADGQKVTVHKDKKSPS